MTVAAIEAPIAGISSLRSTLFRIVTLIGAAAVVWASHSYVTAYGAFAVLCATAVFVSNPAFRPLLAFAALAALFGLPNISSWRGYIEIDTLRLYAAAILSLALPLQLAPDHLQLKRGTLTLGRLGVTILAIHLTLAFLATAALYARLGVIVVQQALRFDVPPAFEYAVKSTLALAPLIPVLVRTSRGRVITLTAAVLPALLIGSRGSVVIALVAYLIALPLASTAGAARHRGSSLRVPTVGVLSIAVIFGGFFLRRAGSSELAAVEVVKDAYFDYDGWWVYPIMPLHLGFREPAGLTNRIVSEGISNDLTSTPLIVADLTTVLPGEQLAAGQALGRIIGAVDAGGLTPGLLGGLFLDFGRWAVVGFLALGVGLLLLASLGRHSVAWALLFITIELQALHLLHRGFLKPEYVTTVAIAAFYLWIARASTHESVA